MEIINKDICNWEKQNKTAWYRSGRVMCNTLGVLTCVGNCEFQHVVDSRTKIGK